MSPQSSVDTVLAWHVALNAADVDGLLALSDPEIELVGPQGSAFGLDVLREWQSKAGLSLKPHDIFATAGMVVVAQHAVWTQAGAVVGQAEVASVFRVRGGAVTYLNRLDALNAALELAGLSSQDRVTF